MVRITEAIFSEGVLKPLENVELRERQHVRLIIQPIEDAPADRATAVAKLRTGIAEMQFFSTGKLPSRDELHDRF